MKSLDRRESPVHLEEGMFDQQKRLLKNRPLQRETGLIWVSVIGPAGASGGSDVPTGE
jgi:hypothetical protein